MKTKLVLAAIVLAAGIAAAAVVTPSANAWDYGALPPGCSQAGTQDAQQADGSHIWSYKTACNGVLSGWMRYGTNPYPQAATDPSFQPNLDAFVDANYTAPATTTVQPTTTTQTTTSTDTTTTPAPTTTSAVQTVTAPGTTTTATPSASPPSASFTAAPTGLSVSFADASKAGSAPLSKITWSFGDGANGVGAKITHAFTAAGDFTVVEHIIDASGLTDDASQVVTVSPFGGVPALAEKLSPSLGTATSQAFGQELAVYCVSSWGPSAKAENGYGLSIVGSHQVNVWAKGCAALATHKGPLALALLVLGHEVAHALGIVSERTADCFGMRRAAKLESALGIADHGQRATITALVRKKWGRC